MPRVCPVCGRPPPKPAGDDVSLGLDGDLRPLLADLRGRQVIPIDEARGEALLREMICSGCGRLAEPG